MYHPHHDEMTQMALGHDGHDRDSSRDAARARACDRDFALMLHEWTIERRHARGPIPTR